MSSPRLPHFNYKGEYGYSITIRCHNQQRLFLEEKIVSICLDHLRSVMDEYHFEIWVYCYMSDHLHLLLVGKDHVANMRKAVKLFKQKTGYYFKKEHQQELWQRSFYDHVLRHDEDIESVVRYILNNPVRAGFVKNFWQYPLSGSFVFDIKQLTY